VVKEKVTYLDKIHEEIVEKKKRRKSIGDGVEKERGRDSDITDTRQKTIKQQQTGTMEGKCQTRKVFEREGEAKRKEKKWLQRYRK